MATGGGGAIRLAVDATAFESQMNRAINQFMKYSVGVQAAAFASTTFNSAGKLTDGVIRAITESGGQMEVAIKKAGRGYQILNQNIRQASASQVKAAQEAEEAANKQAKAAARRQVQVTTFRKEAGNIQKPGTSMSLLPAGVNPVRTRLFQSALKDLEDFVRRGEISAKRAIAIIDEVNKGINRRQKNPQHEEYRLVAMRLVNSARNVKKEVEREQQRVISVNEARKVQPAVALGLGMLPPTASAGAQNRVDGYINSITKAVESSTDTAGLSFKRFHQMLYEFLTGTFIPRNSQERQVAKTIRSISEEIERETNKQAAIIQRSKAKREGAYVAPSIGLTLGVLPNGASAAAQIRVNSYYDKIAKSVETATATSGVQFARFQQLLQDFAAGVAVPVNSAERQLIGGLHRITNEMEKEVNRQAKILQRANAQANSRLVAPTLQAQFGQLQPGASPAAASRLEGYYNRIARAIESSTNSAGVNLPRFQQLVTQFAAGVVAPVNNAERQVVKGLGNIAAEMQKDADRITKTQAQAARNIGAQNASQTIYRRLGSQINALSERDQERVQQQVARLQRLISRANNPLSSGGFIAATNAGFAGKRGNFTGVEEEARRAASRIRAILTGQLSTPFRIHLQAAQHDLQLLRNGLTVLFAGNAVRQLSEGFENLVSKAAEFQRSIALIQTITQDANVSFDQWSSSIEKVSNNLGKPIEEVAQATYDLLSNQVTSGLTDSMQVMNTAAQFARTTNSGIEDSVNLLSSAINTFKLSAGDAERVAASFFTTIDLGRVRTGEMANTIGRSAVYAQTLGVTLEELQAGIITITQTGQKADSSFTLLNNVFQKLLNPTKELQAYYDELGVGTGELFVKTYGFTGALQKLQDATGGSTAKLSDFFNEIRAFGGIDALISRSKQFKGALDELGNSAEKSNVAKMKFDKLPGQQFLQEMTKLKNYFLTGFQTNILKAVLGFTDFEAKIGALTIGLGGLSNTLITFSRIVVTVGTMIAVAFTASKIHTFYTSVIVTKDAMSALTGVTVKWAAISTIAWGGVIILAGVLIASLIKAMDRQREYSNLVTEMSEEVAAKQKAITAAKYSDLRAAYAKDLASEQQSLLPRIAEYVKIAKKRVEIETEASKKIQDSTKNAYENVLSSARASLEALKSKQQEALKFVNDFHETGPNRIRNNRDESLFRYRVAKNNAVNNGDPRIERQLYQKRIRQLNDLAQQAAKKGNFTEARKFLDDKDQLINEISTMTTPSGGMKYLNIERMLRESAKYREDTERRISAILEERIPKQQEAIAKQEDALKSLEDAYKAVYDMDTEKDGKPIYKNKEEFDKEYDKRVVEAGKQTKDYQKNFGTDDPTMSKDLTRRQFAIATGRNAAWREAIGRRFEAESRYAQGTNLQETTTRKTQEADDRFKFLTKRAEVIDNKKTDLKKTFVQNFQPHANQNMIEGELPIGSVDPNSAIHQLWYKGKPEILKRAELMKDIDEAQKSENYDLAAKKIEELMELYKKLGLLKKKIMGAGGEDTTIEANLTAARNAVRQLGQLKQEQVGIEQDLKRPQVAQTAASQALKELEASYGKVGDASNAVTVRIQADFAAQGKMADDLAEKLQRVWDLERQVSPTQDEVDSADYDRKHRYDSMGGPINYYSHGGGPKGTDTIPAWLTPGEYVVNSKQAPRYRAILEAINSGYYNDGGSVYLASGGIFDYVKTHNKKWAMKEQERGEKIAKFNEVMAALEEQGIDPATKAKLTMDFYHPQGKSHREKVASVARSHSRNRGIGVWNPLNVDDGEDAEDYEYHAIGGWAGQDKMPGRISAMNSGFGQKSETHNDSSVNVGDINITVQGGNSGRQTAEQMGREMNRAIRRGSLNLRGN